MALVVSFLIARPWSRLLPYKVGAIDVPKDARRMHKTPIPRLGGLAIFIGFMVSILLFVEITAEMRSILLGAVIIVVLGVVDDIMALPAHAEICGADRGRPDRRHPRRGDPGVFQPQHLFGTIPIGCWAVSPCP